MSSKYLAWIDLETTGSDPKTDHILEVGLILTHATPSLKVIKTKYWLHDPTYQDEGWYNKMSPFVTEMHSKNGLLADLKGTTIRPTLAAIDSQLVILVQELGIKESGDLMLAGSGVSHFDRAFIKRDFPRFHSLLHYPSLDVGVIRRALKMVDSPLVPEDAGADNRSHRALEDVAHHIGEMKRYLDAFAGFSAVYQEALGTSAPGGLR